MIMPSKTSSPAKPASARKPARHHLYTVSPNSFNFSIPENISRLQAKSISGGRDA